MNPLPTVVVALGLVGAAVSAGQAVPPDLVCRGEDVVHVQHSDLKVDRYRSSDLYRFVNGDLFISTDTREEYRYSVVLESDDSLRFVSGHKTIVFENESFTRASAVHVDTIETRVLELRCTRI